MSESPLTLRHVSPLRPLHWLRLGWADLRAQPWSSLSYGVVVAGIGWLLLSLAQQRPQYVPTALGLFFLLAPLIAAGLYELSRARAAGEASGFWLSLGGLRRNAGTIADFGVVLVILAIVWERAAAVYFALAYGGEMDNAEHFIQEVFFSGRYLAVVIVWCFSGAVVAALVFAVTAIGMPLVIDRQVDVVTAMKTSLQAIRLNLPAMLLWAGLIVLLSGLGMAFALAGLIVVMPWLGHATWWAYRDIA
ncbi:MAG TPA: DUF2189 domain-containing protein, partial [Moraxellaceae bacterium]